MKKSLKFVLIICAAFILLSGCVYVYKCLRNYYKTQQLLAAIEHEDIEKVEQLLTVGVDPNRTDIPPSKLWSFFDTSARRPLSFACKTGNLEIVQLLINYGATAEYIPNTGFSPLRETLFYYQPDDVQIVFLLLKNGATAEEEYEGKLAFAAAEMVPRRYDSTKANGTVFADGYDQTTAEGITEIVNLLLENQSINITDKSGESLLIISAKAENVYLAKHLIDKGCDLSIADATGKTALDYASESKNSTLIAIFGQTEGSSGT